MINTVEMDWRFGKIELPAQDLYIYPAIKHTGEYSGREIDIYQSLLKPGDVAVDVGANVGVFTMALGIAVGASGRILAFEPQPPLFEILKRNIARHGLTRVEVHRAIVSDDDGNGEFLEIESLPEAAKLNFGALNVDSRILSGYGRMTPTPVRSIDSFGLDRCDFIKIDVEGGEASVLAGASKTINGHRPILSMECDQPGVASPWADQLFGVGYQLWRFRGQNMRIPNPNGATDGLSNVSIIMVLAIPEEKSHLLEDVDLSDLRALDSRAELEQLSSSIKRAAAP